nr:hypothetical protein GCM10020092_086380 [Actinoplanes digitatis]
MAVLASVAAILLLLRALERPSALRWLCYGLAVAWVAASHLVALMALAAHLVAVAAAARADRERRRRILVGWAAAAGSAVLVSAPLVLVGRGGRAARSAGYPTRPGSACSSSRPSCS